MANIYYTDDANWISLENYSRSILSKCTNSLKEGTSLSHEQITELRLLMADTIAFSDLTEDLTVVRDYRIREIKSVIKENYKLTDETPDFISKYLK
jgi:hypothetical protein